MNKLSMMMVVLAGLAGVAMADSPEWGKAPADIATLAKQTAGTWKCKGQGVGPDMKMADMAGTMKMGKLESENWWIHDSFDSKTGKTGSYHFDSYVTMDPTSKKWHRVMIESGGGYSTGDSAGMTGGKIDWEMTANGPMGQAMFRDHIDASDAKAGVKTWGEASMDKGKSWTKVYEMTCKK
jgi:hypothetical protein